MTTDSGIALPPDELTEIAARCEARLKVILSAERQQWSALDPSLDEPLGDLADMILSGGKRIRPAYCHWGWCLGRAHSRTSGRGDNGSTDGRGSSDGDRNNAGGDGALDAGCALEILHAFALAHDDVMDGSTTRRGEPTVWRKFTQRHHQRGWHGENRRFGEAAAVLVGDMAIVLADRTLGEVTTATRAVWNELRTELNMGQYLDMVGSAQGRPTADGARRIIEHKTARYTIVRPLQLGAALAGAPELAEPLQRHGLPVGLAFQLQDDMLGAFGDPAATGKPVGDDLREGKPTLLLAVARDAANAAQLQLLDAVGSELDDEAVAQVQQVLVDTGAADQVNDEISKLLQQALDALEALPEVPAVKETLAATAQFIAKRQA